MHTWTYCRTAWQAGLTARRFGRFLVLADFVKQLHLAALAVWAVMAVARNTRKTSCFWFGGFGGNIAAVSWIGYDQLRSLGDRETGSRAALPIWAYFMKEALAGRAEADYSTPAGVVIADIDKKTGQLLTDTDADGGRAEYFYRELLPAAQPTPNAGETEDLF